MIEALTRKELEARNMDAIVQSAGMLDREPSPASDLAQQTMQDYGIDISEHKSQAAKNLNLAEFDFIFCVDQKIKNGLIELGADPDKVHIINEKDGGIPNPYDEKTLEAYRACAAAIETAVVKSIPLIEEKIREKEIAAATVTE